MRYLLGSGRTLIIRGPAAIQLLGGQAHALGAPFESQRVIVRKDKQLPVETSSEAELEIVPTDPKNLFEIEGSTIPSSWHSALGAICEMKEGKVLIIGGADVGKSTLTTFLANGLLREGINCRIVDADIGQADIGPPTTIASAVASDYVFSLVDLNPSTSIFVGHTTPNKVQTKLIHGLQKLSNHEQQSLTLINTDGWTLDPEAIVYKLEMVEEILPDLVLGITVGKELEPLLSRIDASMRIEAPQTVLARSRSDRREIRTAGYRRYLDGGKTRTYQRHEVRVTFPDVLKLGRPQASSDLVNLIVGLLDNDGFLLQVGVLLHLDEDQLRVFSRHAERPSEVELGFVKLSTDGVEQGYLDV
jgi:polynucleotide 5'-hydroxyl-kinase GRC3/NOL9